jgi:chromate reductase, NAD(P)H dehydrogenase (quinone)
MAISGRRIAVLVGSIRADSFNRRLALAIARMAPLHVFHHVEIGQLPPYNQDHDADLPAPARALKQQIEGCEALLFVTPEYNRSVPGVLKNAIDIASRPYGKNSFAGKPAGVIGTSPGAIGTALAQQHLRSVLTYLDVPMLAQPEAYLQFSEGLIDAGGAVTKESAAKFLQDWVDAYVGFIETVLARPATASGR